MCHDLSIEYVLNGFKAVLSKGKLTESTNV